MVRTVGILLGCREIYDILIVYLMELEMAPVRLLHLLPAAEGVQPEFEKPGRLLLACRNTAYDVFGQTFREKFLLDLRNKPLSVFLRGYFFKRFVHCCTKILKLLEKIRE